MIIAHSVVVSIGPPLEVRSPSSPKMSSPKWAHLPTENWGHLQVRSPSSPNWAHPDELTEINCQWEIEITCQWEIEITCHLTLSLIKTYLFMFITNVAMDIIWNFDVYIRGEYFFLIIHFCSNFWFFNQKNSDPCLKLYIKGEEQ